MTTDPLRLPVLPETFGLLPFPPGWDLVDAEDPDERTVPVVRVRGPKGVPTNKCDTRSDVHVWFGVATLRHLDTIARVYLPARGCPYPYSAQGALFQ